MRWYLLLVPTVAIVAACALLLLVRCSIRAAQEHFENCHFYADSGYLCPIHVDTDRYSVRPWDEVTSALQRLTVAALTSEWGPGYSVQQITNTWHSSDTFYVMASHAGGFMGCVALDRRQLYPFVTNLFVAPEHRNQGNAGVLLDVCERHASAMKFTEIRLWCDAHLVPFYVHLGWVPEQELDGKTVCVKALSVSPAR